MSNKLSEPGRYIVPSTNTKLSTRSSALAGRGLALLKQMAAQANWRSGLGWTSLHIAALGDHKKEAEMLINQGADVNAKDKFGHTPLFFAKSAYLAYMLIGHGADVNTKREDGATPLHKAAKSGNRQVAKALLDSGAGLNVRKNGATPLQIASRNGHWAVVELLIARGADVNARDSNNETPLSAAITGNHRNIAELIKRHGGII